jgi:hypothetical protein
MIASILSLTIALADSSCHPVRRPLDGPQLVQTALERTGLAAARGRALHVTGYDLHDQAFESDRTYPPALIDVSDLDYWFDPQSGVERATSQTSIAGYHLGGATMSNESRAYRLRDSSLTASEAVHADSWAARPLDVWAMLEDWSAAPDVRVVERCVYRDYPRVVLTRQGLRGAERLFIDEKSGYPVKLDRVEPHYLWGQVHVEFVYSTWELFDGVHLPGGVFRLADGIPDITRVFSSVRLAPRDSVSLRLPAGPPMGFAVAPFLVPSRPDTMRVSATTFVLANPGYRESVTLAHDTVFVFDATQGDGRAREDAKWIETLFPGRHPIVVVVTDLAWPHVAGVRYWVAQGATIVSHRAARPFLQRVVDRRWTLNPDALERARVGHPLRFRAVSDSTSMGDGAIALFPIDGVATEVALAAFVRKDSFLWASDYIQDLTAPSQYVDEVVSAVTRFGFRPRTVAAEHTGITDWTKVAVLASPSTRRE